MMYWTKPLRGDVQCLRVIIIINCLIHNLLKQLFLDFLVIFFQWECSVFNCFVIIHLIFFLCILPLFLCFNFLFWRMKIIHENRGFCNITIWNYCVNSKNYKLISTPFIRNIFEDPNYFTKKVNCKIPHSSHKSLFLQLQPKAHKTHPKARVREHSE